MRIRRSHTSGSCWKVRLTSDEPASAPAVPQAPYQASALKLPGEQKFGLVFLRKSGPDSLAAKICTHLNQQGIPFPTGRHWHELRTGGYVTWEVTRHVLTPKGHGAAQAIMRDLAIKFAIHDITRSGGRGQQSGTFVKCSCGRFSAGPFATNNAGESRIKRAIAGHFRGVENGFPVKRPLIEFLNEYDPLSFDFGSRGGPQSPGTGVSCVSAAVPGNGVEERP